MLCSQSFKESHVCVSAQFFALPNNTSHKLDQDFCGEQSSYWRCNCEWCFIKNLVTQLKSDTCNFIRFLGFFLVWKTTLSSSIPTQREFNQLAPDLMYGLAKVDLRGWHLLVQIRLKAVTLRICDIAGSQTVRNNILMGWSLTLTHFSVILFVTKWNCHWDF